MECDNILTGAKAFAVLSNTTTTAAYLALANMVLGAGCGAVSLKGCATVSKIIFERLLQQVAAISRIQMIDWMISVRMS